MEIARLSAASSRVRTDTGYDRQSPPLRKSKNQTVPIGMSDTRSDAPSVELCRGGERSETE